MDVEDLIASMHVGREACELKALQAHLSKTLNYNPETSTYQPVQGVHYIPPPPVSSLNSMASTSYGTSYHQYPTHPNLVNNQGRAVRPQCTPAHSYRGFQPTNAMADDTGDEGQAMDTDMDDVTEAGDPSKPSHDNILPYDLHRRLPSPPDERDEADFAAFSSDAFAPIYANDLRSPKSDPSKPPDHWSAFRPLAESDGARGGGNQAFRDLSTSPTWSLNGQSTDRVGLAQNRFDLSSPEQVPADLAGNWSGGRLRSTNAREQRKLQDDNKHSRRK